MVPLEFMHITLENLGKSFEIKTLRKVRGRVIRHLKF